MKFGPWLDCHVPEFERIPEQDITWPWLHAASEEFFKEKVIGYEDMKMLIDNSMGWHETLVAEI